MILVWSPTSCVAISYRASTTRLCITTQHLKKQSLNGLCSFCWQALYSRSQMPEIYPGSQGLLETQRYHQSSDLAPVTEFSSARRVFLSHSLASNLVQFAEYRPPKTAPRGRWSWKLTALLSPQNFQACSQCASCCIPRPTREVPNIALPLTGGCIGGCPFAGTSTGSFS